MTQHKNNTRCGYVALIGAPNAGKSTLLNALLGQKLAIVSAKPQTTRTAILGIVTEGPAQLCFLDTPGLFAANGKFEQSLVAAAQQAIADADVVVMVMDATQRREGLDEVVGKIPHKKPAFLVINKVDKFRNKEKLLPLIKQWQDKFLWKHIFLLSALKNDGVADVMKHLTAAVPEGPWLYGDDVLTTLPERDLAAEVTREQLYHQLHQELPYDATVRAISWEERKDGSVAIAQEIVVMRANQRKIVLGAGGQQLKAIGVAARTELAKVLDRKVHLNLTVVVDETWKP
ncbi:MAG: GTPase Era [Alphaproteobacteria bacterium]|nr:GTPase Era [Alphaproteobacteria bacterium]NDC56236.1 GTPase Era [Alphaproteobacteria bacterium]NDG04347.1 GTPase Era [Alphaproteobacteria bacterium]